MKEQPIGWKRVKVTLEQAMKAQKGSNYSSTLSLTLVVKGEGGQHHALAALPCERPGPHCIGGWVGPRASLDLLTYSMLQSPS